VPGLYPAHSLAHSMEILSTRSRGVVSLVSTARLNISRRLRGAPSGSGLARTSVAPSANLNLVTVRKRQPKKLSGQIARMLSTSQHLDFSRQSTAHRELIKRTRESHRLFGERRY
jgi:hypothetical protein